MLATIGTRIANRSYAVILVVIGSLVIASVIWAHGTGLDLAIGGMAIFGGIQLLRWHDQSMATAVKSSAGMSIAARPARGQ